jgi:hypothetical protein
MLTAEQWKERGMEKYGLIARNAAGGAAQVEKVTTSPHSSRLAHTLLYIYTVYIICE